MTSLAEHIPLVELSRFVETGRVESAAAARVRRHLASGCEMCEGIVAQIRERMEVERRVRTLFKPVRQWVVPQVAEVSAGLRVGALADLQLVCAVGGYELEILVRDLESSDGLEIRGQITRLESVQEPVPDLQLTLFDSHRSLIVDDTSTDDFGEFDLLSRHDGRLGLRIGAAPDAPCVLVWEGDLW